jgi:aspartyl-tRNA(Asn)/glutamyl-tRNA(Gln) amidotransferase subunit A
VAKEPGLLTGLREKFLNGEITPKQVAAEALQKSNQNGGRNVYLAQDRDWTLREAERVERNFSQPEKPPLFGLPVSLKDCFDLEGFKTTAGTRFYSERNQPATADSAVAARLREQGAVITGKTHLHPLAYGITGENRDFGDCTQPGDASLLTGGSSSGGAASVQEGSAVAAIGTDTGGSIRVPCRALWPCWLSRQYRAGVGEKAVGWWRAPGRGLRHPRLDLPRSARRATVGRRPLRPAHHRECHPACKGRSRQRRFLA